MYNNEIFIKMKWKNISAGFRKRVWVWGCEGVGEGDGEDPILTPIRLPRFELVKESAAESAVRSSLSEQNEKYFIIYGHLCRKKRKKCITRSKRAGQAINIIYI